MNPNLELGNIVITGAPACGKGTQCELLVQRYGLLHISTGDLLRARRRFMPELAGYMDKGLLVPDELICQVLKERLSEPDASGRGFLLDGFPRTRSQAELLSVMGLKVRSVIHFEHTCHAARQSNASKCSAVPPPPPPSSLSSSSSS